MQTPLYILNRQRTQIEWCWRRQHDAVEQVLLLSSNRGRLRHAVHMTLRSWVVSHHSIG